MDRNWKTGLVVGSSVEILPSALSSDSVLRAEVAAIKEAADLLLRSQGSERTSDNQGFEFIGGAL